MQKKWMLPALLAAACFAGCSTMEVNSDYDPAVDFSGLQTYAWVPEEKLVRANPPLYDSLMDSRIKKAVEERLEKNGYAAAVKTPPDFYITYHVTVQTKVDVDTVTEIYGHWGWNRGRWIATEPIVRHYEVGTLILDMVDPGLEKLLFRGYARARINDRDSPQKKEQQVREAVRRILELFPPGKEK